MACSGEKQTAESSDVSIDELHQQNNDATADAEAEASHDQQNQSEAKPETGALGGILGEWTVDAATAGLQMDLRFNDDGSFWHSMGGQEAEGTWEMVDDDHIKIVTPNVPNGQTWLISNLNDSGVEICWNPESNDPKTIPFQRK